MQAMRLPGDRDHRAGIALLDRGIG